MFVRRLVMEPLENRWLLNGDPVLSEVSAQIKGGWLQVTGDNGDNEIFIQKLEETYTVSVGEGTKFKGTDETELTFDAASVTKGIKADLKKGDDFLVLIGGVAGDVSVKMGDGSDIVVLGSSESDPVAEGEDGSTSVTVTGKTTVDLGGKGEESGFFAGDTVFAKDVTIKSGNVSRSQEGFAFVGFENCEVNGKLTVTTGNTDEDVWMSGTTVTADVSIKTGAGGDWVGIYPQWEGDLESPAATSEDGQEYTIGGKLSVDVGHDWGGIWLGVSVQKDVSLRAGNAPAALDEEYEGYVSVSDVDLGGKLTIKTGNGGWFVGLLNVDVGGDASITTGSGDDEILVDGSEDFGEEGSGAGEASIYSVARGFGGKLTIKTGSGTDAVGVVMTPRFDEDLVIETGNGNDLVSLQQLVVTGNASVKTGNGDDVIACAAVSANHVTLHSGNANRGSGDAVLFTNSPATVLGNLTITTGTGNDMVGVGKSDIIDQALLNLLDELPEDWAEYVSSETGAVDVVGKLTVKTGGGNDEVSIGDGAFGGSVSVDTGGGTDGCVIESSSTDGGASIKMGSGDGDYLEIGDVAVAGSVLVDGGSGQADELELWGSWPDPDVFKGFEIHPFL